MITQSCLFNNTHSFQNNVFQQRFSGWSNTSSMNQARESHIASVLTSGKVLVTGGSNDSVLNSAEFYDLSAETWTTTDSMHQARVDHIVSVLTNGKVLVTAGLYGSRSILNTAELYDPST